MSEKNISSLKLRNGRRFYTFILIVIITVTAINIMIGFTSQALGFSEPGFRIITVTEGDTLWDLASEHFNNVDIRKIVYDIKKLNGLKDSNLYAGQELKIPSR